jgi:tetratricopeptide (TPR) repeat protein
MSLTELEKSFNSIAENGSPVEVVTAAIPLVNAYQQGRKFDSAIRCLQKALAVIEKKEATDQEAVILTALGTAFWEKAQLQKALDQFSPALKLFKQSGDKIGEQAVLAMVGITFWRKCEWKRSLEILTGVLHETDDLKVDARFASVQGALERGIATLQNRVRMGRELQDPLKILQPLFSVCALYRVLGNREQFVLCIAEAVALAQSLNKTDILDAAESLKKL